MPTFETINWDSSTIQSFDTLMKITFAKNKIWRWPNIWFVSKKNTSFIALIWGFTNFQEMKLICSLFYHRISGRYLANIFFHLTMYGWDSLSSLYTRDIMEIWHIHVSAVLKDYNGTTFIILFTDLVLHLQDYWYMRQMMI